MDGGAPIEPAFDQRPGALEATRGLDTAPLYALGHRTLEGWRVRLMRAGVVVHDLDAEAAIVLGVDLVKTGTLLRDRFEVADAMQAEIEAYERASRTKQTFAEMAGKTVSFTMTGGAFVSVDAAKPGGLVERVANEAKDHVLAEVAADELENGCRVVCRSQRVPHEVAPLEIEREAPGEQHHALIEDAVVEDLPIKFHALVFEVAASNLLKLGGLKWLHRHFFRAGCGDRTMTGSRLAHKAGRWMVHR